MHQTLEKLIEYFIYSGKLVKQIKDVMVCVTLKTEDLVFLLCPQLKQSIKLQYQVMLGLVYYLKQEQMQKNVYRQSCSNIS